MKIFDGHNDILHRINTSSNPLDTKTFLVQGKGHLDLPRALQGELMGGFFAVFTPDPPEIPPDEERIVLNEIGYQVPLPPPLNFEYAQSSALKMIELLDKIQSDSMGQLQIVRTFRDLSNCLEKNILAAVLHLEGAEPIEPDLERLEYFFERGVRSLGITWSRPNAFGSGVPFSYPGHPDCGPGLTVEGKNLVTACNQLGIMIDLAHLNEKGFWDVVELSAAPLVSTHTAAHSLIPKARNLTDDQLKAIGDSSGVVGVIFSVNDLAGERRPLEDAPASEIIRHISYIANLIGIDHVAFGSDFDGTKIPSQLGDVSNYQLLVRMLKDAGFSNEEIEKICWKNWFRVLDKTWLS
jgi:membrane dipeptidase